MDNGVSIIIAHLEGEREEYFANLVSRLESQLSEKTYPWEILCATEGDRVVARNISGGKAKYPILVFFDDDIETTPDTIDELVAPFFDLDNVGVVGGVNVTFPEVSHNEKLAGRLLANVLATGRSSARYSPKGVLRHSDEAELQSCVMAVRKSLFLEVGGFPPVFPGEENIFYNRVADRGYSLIYNPAAIVYHRRPPLYIPYFSAMHYYGRGRGYMIRMGYRPKMVYGVSFDTVRLFLGWIGGTVAYILGVARGFITYRCSPELWDWDRK